MKQYQLTNEVTGEIFEASFRTLYYLGNRLMRDAIRKQEFGYLNLDAKTKNPWRPRCVIMFLSSVYGKPSHEIVYFSRG